MSADDGVNDGHAAEAEEEEIEQIEQTAPIFPWEILFRNSDTFFQRRPGGGMLLKFCPLAKTPIGNQPIPPGLVIDFNESGWAHFQKEVAAGMNLERVAIATSLPPGVRLDG